VPQSAVSLLWPAVDLGGTSIRVLLVADHGEEGPRPVVRVETPTPRGLGALVEGVRDALTEASGLALDGGHRVAPVLAIGSPGRLQAGPDGRRTIAPRSATNLEAFPGEMDGVDLAGELATALDLSRSRVFWDNDAVVQGRFMIGELLRDRDSSAELQGHAVVCINPGTGLGGCVALVSDDDTIEVFTDSHISELLLHPVELERELGPFRAVVRSTADGSHIGLEARVEKAQHGELLASPVTKQAEDFLSGTGLSLIAAGLDRCAAQLLPSGHCFAEHIEEIDGALLSALLEGGSDSTPTRVARFIGELGGLALSRLLIELRDGSAKKSPSFPDWSEPDLDRLRGVCRFVLGGGITGTPLGQYMIAEARQRLRGWPELTLFEMDEIADDAGALGAFSLIPDSLRRTIED
jgi:hypothetical protein